MSEDPITISATELRNQLRDVLEKAKFQGARFVVYTHGKPMAVVVGLDEYTRLMAPSAGTGKIQELRR